LGGTHNQLQSCEESALEIIGIYSFFFVGISAATEVLYLMVLKKVVSEALYTHLVKFMSMRMTKLSTAYMIESAFSKEYVSCTSLLVKST
jgi:hypothetical protein